MKGWIKKAGVLLIIVLIYFTGWRWVRGFVTDQLVIPQIEYARDLCNEIIEYEKTKSTSLFIYIYDSDIQDYHAFGYVTPAGFYLLFGLVVIIVMNGGKLFYQLLFGYHLVFWVVSVSTVYAGLCFHPVFLHVTRAGIQYFTPFITFLILLLLVSPPILEKLKLTDTEM